MKTNLVRPARLPLIGVFVALLILVSASLGPASVGLKRAAGIRSLLGAMLAEPDQAANRLIPCASDPLATTHARRLTEEALGQWQSLALSPEQSVHLRGTAYCLLSESESAEQLYQATAGLPYTVLQQIGITNWIGQTEQSVQLLAKADLSQPEALAILAGLIHAHPELNWRPHLSMLAEQYAQDKTIWRLWWQIGLNLEQAGDWASAASWFQSGTQLAESQGVSFFLSSFYLQIGRYYQVYRDPPDPQRALDDYNQALELGQYFYSGELATNYFLRGEVYRNLKTQYSPQQALAQFQKALSLAPDSYWVYLGIGHLYLVDLNDDVQAESYYRQAQDLNPLLPNAPFFLGNLYNKRGDPHQAEIYFRQALTLQPDFQPALNELKALGVSP